MSPKETKALLPSPLDFDRADPRSAQVLRMVESGMTFMEIIEAWYEQGRKDGAIELGRMAQQFRRRAVTRRNRKS